MTDTKTAVAWSLHSPSASGGKVYNILLFDRYVLVGYGSLMGTMQYKCYTLASTENARVTAVAMTSQKEAKGYQLLREPLESHVPASQWQEELPRYAAVRGASAYLDMVFRMFFTEGRPISE